MDRVTAVLGSRPAFYAAVGGYYLLLLALKLTLTQSASEDIAEQLFFAQSWEPVYKPTQPPLFTWIVQAVFSLTGPSIAVVEGLRFALLWGLAVVLFEIGHQLAEPPSAGRRLAVACGLVPVFTYLIAWDALLNYTNTLLMLAFAAASVLAWLRLATAASRPATVALVLTSAGGVLAKYAFLPLVVAIWLLPVRAGAWTLRRRALAAAALGGLLAFPVGGLLLAEDGIDSINAADIVGTPGVAALSEMLVSMVSAWAPFIVTAGGLVVAMTAMRRRPTWSPAGRSLARLTVALISMLVVCTVVAAAVLGVTSFKNHWFLVALPALVVVLVPLYDAGAPEGLRRIYETVGFGLAGLVPVALIVFGLVKPLTCDSCENFMDFDRLAAELRAAGFDGGTILTMDYPDQVGGNLRPFFPDSRFASIRFLYAPPVPETPTRGCVVIWLEDAIGPDLDYPEYMGGHLRDRMQVPAPDAADLARFEVPVGIGGGRTLRFEGWVFDRPVGRCG